MSGSLNHISLGNKNKLPQFYFGNNHVSEDIVERDEKIINQIYKDKEYLTLEEFIPITVELLGFPRMLNQILFKKIDKEGKNKIHKNVYLR